MKPFACTAGSPPDDSRMVWAILRASSRACGWNRFGHAAIDHRQLQPLNARRERRLAHEEGLSRAANRAETSYLPEGLELSELRGHYISHADATHHENRLD